jgi:eukaryotic-like serine/threonine-protein kinase
LSDQELVGQTVAGKYLIKRLLGTGGMGAVFEGENVEIGKRVAVKVIHASHAGSSVVAERFRREARAASKVESDSIVDVFDVGTDPRIGLYMVMEYLSGEDLSARLEREKRIDVSVVIDVGIQAARALAKAHAAGVIHRDLKPANLFLTRRDDDSLLVKVLDFGISKLTDDARSPRTSDAPKALTRAGTVVGTAQYMSPEQAQGLPIDLRTDVWSLGAVLYEILAGKPPFPEMATYELTIIQIVTRRPTPLREAAPWVPEELAAIVDTALTPELEGRLPNCGVLARRLTALGAQVGRVSAAEDRSSGALLRASVADSIPRPTQEAMTNQGVAVRSFVRGNPTPTTIGAIGAGILALVLLGWAGLRAFQPRPASVGLVMPSPPPPALSTFSAEPATPPAFDSVAGTVPIPSPSPAPTASVSAALSVTVTPELPPGPTHPPAARTPGTTNAAAKSQTPKTSGKAQIGGAGVDPTY